MINWIIENKDALIVALTTVASFAGMFIPKIVGDAKSRKLLKSINVAQSVADTTHQALLGFTNGVASSLDRIEVDNNALNQTLEEVKVLNAEIKASRELNLELQRDLASLKDEVNLLRNREM